VATATIAGVEMGGALAVQFALDFPEKCAGIVISGTNSGPGHPAAKPGQVSSSYQAMRGALLREFDDDSLVDDALVRARYEARLRSNDGYTISRHLADHRAPYSTEELSHVAAPALVIWCEHDDMTPPDWGQAYADALKSSRFVLIKACSRVPNLERPDDYNAALRAFLKR
jgi:pimeloyl-ACP methyl ester carboxylesterase